MTDLENSTPVVGEGVPTPASQPQVATSSQATTNLEALLKEVTDLKGQVRALQSEKDKGTHKLEKRVDKLDEVIAKYEELRGEGLSKSRALREMQMDAFLQEQNPENAVPASVQPAQGSAPAEPTRLEMEAILSTLGLDANDPQVVEAMRLSPIDRIAQFTKIAVDRKQTPNPAAVQNVGGGSAVLPEEDLTAVREKLAAMRSLPAYKMDSKEYQRLYEMERRLARQQ